jgi:hypothetical protein
MDENQGGKKRRARRRGKEVQRLVEEFISYSHKGYREPFKFVGSAVSGAYSTIRSSIDIAGNGKCRRCVATTFTTFTLLFA